MVNVPDFLNEATESNFLGNTTLDYLVSVFLFVVSFTTLYIFKFLILRNLVKSSFVKKSSFINILIKSLRKYFSFTFILILSIYLGFQYLTFPSYISTFTDFIVLAFIGWLIIKLVNNILDSVIETQKESEEPNLHILEFFNLVSRSFVSVVVIIWILSNIGVNVTSFIAGLGIVSLAIAFALRELIADIFASIVLMIDKPFEIGDSIKIGDDSGVVETIGIRSTQIRATGGYLIISSNRELTDKRINNMKQMDKRRVSILLQISQQTSKEKLALIPQIVSGIIMSNPNLNFDKVNLMNIGDYSYDFEIIYYVKTRDFKSHLTAKQELLFLLIEKLSQEKINLPYPTKTIIVDD